MLSAPRMSACSAVNPQSRQTNWAWLVRFRLSMVAAVGAALAGVRGVFLMGPRRAPGEEGTGYGLSLSELLVDEPAEFGESGPTDATAAEPASE